jgi:hypothetical protein
MTYGIAVVAVDGRRIDADLTKAEIPKCQQNELFYSDQELNLM